MTIEKTSLLHRMDAGMIMIKEVTTMPMIDLPLRELETYQGINPKPSDFDRYWDAALEELEKVDPSPELVPSIFQAPSADCYHLYFTGVGAVRIHAQLLKPRNTIGRGPGLVRFHGYSANAGDWSEKLVYTAQGFVVAAMDCRGQGGLSETYPGRKHSTLRGILVGDLNEPPETFLYRAIYLDAVQLVRVLMKLDGVDPLRIGVMGGSQGGALSLAAAALEPGIQKCAPLYPFLCDFQRVWELDLGEQPYEELKNWFRRFDPTHSREQEIFTRLGYLDVQFLAPRIRGEVLMGTGLMDRICPPSTQFAVYHKINARKRMILYPDFGHESIPGFADEVFQFMMELAR